MGGALGWTIGGLDHRSVLAPTHQVAVGRADFLLRNETRGSGWIVFEALYLQATLLNLHAAFTQA